jgi:hypothetical protein
MADNVPLSAMKLRSEGNKNAAETACSPMEQTPDPPPYEGLACAALDAQDADGVVVIVFRGRGGTGFAAVARPEAQRALSRALPYVLLELAGAFDR